MIDMTTIRGRPYYYRLDGHVPAPCSLEEMGRAVEDRDKHIVAHTMIGEILVSTVFLCIDHRFVGEGPPVVFETMVFGGPFDDEQERYCTWDEAAAGHEAMVAKVRSQVEVDD